MAWSSSAGTFFAVFDSGRLICTSGWSRLKVVETTKKISRMVKISTSETMMMDGARRLRTANFIGRDLDLALRHRRGRGRDWLRWGHWLSRRYLLRPRLRRQAPVITFGKKIGHERFHFDGEHFHFL